MDSSPLSSYNNAEALGRASSAAGGTQTRSQRHMQYASGGCCCLLLVAFFIALMAVPDAAIFLLGVVLLVFLLLLCINVCSLKVRRRRRPRGGEGHDTDSDYFGYEWNDRGDGLRVGGLVYNLHDGTASPIVVITGDDVEAATGGDGINSDRLPGMPIRLSPPASSNGGGGAATPAVRMNSILAEPDGDAVYGRAEYTAPDEDASKPNGGQHTVASLAQPSPHGRGYAGQWPAEVSDATVSSPTPSQSSQQQQQRVGERIESNGVELWFAGDMRGREEAAGSPLQPLGLSGPRSQSTPAAKVQEGEL